jgi:hypothetical protein
MDSGLVGGGATRRKWQLGQKVPTRVKIPEAQCSMDGNKAQKYVRKNKAQHGMQGQETQRRLVACEAQRCGKHNAGGRIGPMDFN